jgi:hypothetical protein
VFEDEVSEMANWLKSDHAIRVVYGDSTRDLETYARGRPVRHIGVVLHALEMLGSYCMIEGAVNVMRSAVAGWHGMHRGMNLQYWSIRIGVRQWDHDTRVPKASWGLMVNPAALLLAQAIATNTREVADWMGDRLTGALVDGTFGAWELNPFEPFMATLFAKYRGVDLDLRGRYVGGFPIRPVSETYAQVFANWHDAKNLATSLVQACEYHLARTAEPSDEDAPEFGVEPYQVFPAEIIAVLCVRRWLGLSVPVVEHPLMQTPLASPPDQPAPLHDHLLDKVIERARRELSDI